MDERNERGNPKLGGGDIPKPERTESDRPSEVPGPRREGRSLSSALGSVTSLLSKIVRTGAENATSGGRSVSDGGRGAYQERRFLSTLSEGIKQQTSLLREVSQSLKGIEKSVKSIEITLKDWFEKRNQITLKDLLSFVSGSLGGIARGVLGAARGALDFLRDLVLYRMLSRSSGRVPRGPARPMGPPPILGDGEGKRKVYAPKGPVPVFTPPPLRPKSPPAYPPPRVPTPVPRVPTPVETGKRALDTLARFGGALGKVGGATARALSRIVPGVGIALLGLDFARNFAEAREKHGGGVGGVVKSAASAAISTLTLGLVPSEVSSLIVGRFSSFISDVFSGAKRFVGSLVSSVSKRLSELVSGLVDGVKSAVDQAVSSVSGALSSISSRVRDAVSSSVSFVEGMFSSVRESVSSLASGVVDGVSRLFDSLSSFFSEIVDRVSKPVSEIKDRVSSAVSSVSEGLLRVGRGVVDFGKGVLDRIFSPGPKKPGGGAAEGGQVKAPPVTGVASREREPGSFSNIGVSAKYDLSSVYRNIIVPSVGNFPITQLIGQNRPYKDPTTGLEINPMGYGKFGHMGIDVATPLGTPVRAPFDGVVIDASGGAWGKSIYLVGKQLAVRFSHLSKISVPSGTHVSRGQEIARTGNTGNSTGPHLDVTFYRSSGGKVGTWISNYGVINTLADAEIKRRPLTKEEAEMVAREARKSVPGVSASPAPGEVGLVPIASPFGLFMENVAQTISGVLGVDLTSTLEALKRRMAEFQEGFGRASPMTDIRVIEKRAMEIIGKPERFQAVPYIAGINGYVPLKGETSTPKPPKPGRLPTKPTGATGTPRPPTRSVQRPASKPTQPSSKPTQSTQPSSKPTQAQAKPSAPTTQAKPPAPVGISPETRKMAEEVKKRSEQRFKEMAGRPPMTRESRTPIVVGQPPTATSQQVSGQGKQQQVQSTSQVKTETAPTPGPIASEGRVQPAPSNAVPPASLGTSLSGGEETVSGVVRVQTGVPRPPGLPAPRVPISGVQEPARADTFSVSGTQASQVATASPGSGEVIPKAPTIPPIDPSSALEVMRPPSTREVLSGVIQSLEAARPPTGPGSAVPRVVSSSPRQIHGPSSMEELILINTLINR